MLGNPYPIEAEVLGSDRLLNFVPIQFGWVPLPLRRVGQVVKQPHAHLLTSDLPQPFTSPEGCPVFHRVIDDSRSIKLADPEHPHERRSADWMLVRPAGLRWANAATEDRVVVV